MTNVLIHTVVHATLVSVVCSAQMNIYCDFLDGSLYSTHTSEWSQFCCVLCALHCSVWETCIVKYFNNLFIYLLMDIPVKRLFNRLYCAGVRGIFFKSGSSLSIVLSIPRYTSMHVSEYLVSIPNKHKHVQVHCTFIPSTITPLKDPTLCVI